MAYVKKHCSGCSGCNNSYAHADCANNSYSRGSCGGCSSCGHHHGCGCNHHHGCSSCNSGCGSCRGNSYGNNGYGVLRSVSGPFSNCGNWWNNSDSCFPYYTGPCGPCEPCGQCCCREWPWPWPPVMPVMPVNYGYGGCESETGYIVTGGRSGSCHNCADEAAYTSRKNCYCTEASSREACAAKRVKPIVDCANCNRRCDCDD